MSDPLENCPNCGIHFDSIVQMCNIADNLLASLESVANFLRGMQLDRSIPFHALDAIRERVALIDELTESVTMPDPKIAAPMSETPNPSNSTGLHAAEEAESK